MDPAINRPHQCLHCGRRFTTKLFLKRHFAVHSTLRNFKCSLCLSTYKYKKGLNRHIKKFHPEDYSALKICPTKKRNSIKVEENPAPIFKIIKRTPDGIIEEIPPVAPTRTDPEPVPEQHPNTLDAAIAIEEPKIRQDQNFLKYFMEKLKKKEVKIGNCEKKNSLDDSLREFNKVLSENFIEFTSSMNVTVKGEEYCKGFVPVVEEKSDGKIGFAGHKKIEYLEEVVKKYKCKESSLSMQIYAERQKQEKVKKRLERLKKLYRLQIFRRRKLAWGICQVQVKIEEN